MTRRNHVTRCLIQQAKKPTRLYYSRDRTLFCNARKSGFRWWKRKMNREEKQRKGKSILRKGEEKKYAVVLKNVRVVWISLSPNVAMMGGLTSRVLSSSQRPRISLELLLLSSYTCRWGLFSTAANPSCARTVQEKSVYVKCPISG